MLFLVLGSAIVVLLLLLLRAFERAPPGSIITLLKWIAAFFGLAVTVLLLLSGRLPQALAGLAFFGPVLWRRWQGGGFGGGFGNWFGPGGSRPGGMGGGPFGGGQAGSPPRSSGGAMTQAEAYEVLGLKPGASAAEIQAAHHRLMRGAHPDAGGSDWLASRINQARDVLLG